MSTACSTFPGMPLSSEISTSTLRGARCVRGAIRVGRQREGRGVTPRRGGRVRMRNRGGFLRHAGAHRVSRRARAPELVALLAAARQRLFMDLNMTAQRRAEPLRARHAQPTPGFSLRDRAMKNCAVGVGRHSSSILSQPARLAAIPVKRDAADGAFFSQRREVKKNPTTSSPARLPFHLRSPLPRPSLP